MEQCEDRMAAKHAGAGESHHIPDPLSHYRRITVYPAPAACGFLLLERTFGQASFRIIQKFSAPRTKFIIAIMPGTAGDMYHCLNSLSFSFHSVVFHG
jgi:hypothetical protein